MEINEVKTGDMVTFTHNKKKVTGKVIYRHDSADNKKAERASLMGHVNVEVMDNKSYPVTVHVSKLKPAIQEEINMEEMNENVLDLIDRIDNGDNLEAEQLLNDILSTRIEEVLDAVKIEVASSMFNTENCAECEETNEALKGNQHKIDANKNGKIDAHDFKLLGRKKLKLLGRKTPKSERMDRNLAKRVENNKSMKVEQNVFTGHKNIKHANLETPETQKRRDDDVKKRQAGRVAVIKKLNAKGAKIGEEVKQIDELSKQALSTYVKKAGPQIAGLEQKHGIASKPAMKRRRGVTRASINYLKKDLGMPTRKEEA